MAERRVTVRGIIFKDDKLFVQKLKDGDGEKPFWCIPGGGLEFGESLHGGLTREMIEETGIAPKIGKLLMVQQYADLHKEFLEFFFHVENPDAYHTIDLESTTHGMIEVARCEFVDPRKTVVLPKIFQTIDLAELIDRPASIEITNYLNETK